MTSRILLVAATVLCAACGGSSGAGSAGSQAGASSPGLAEATRACDLRAVTASEAAGLASTAASKSAKFSKLNKYVGELADADAMLVGARDLNTSQNAQVQENGYKALVISECHDLGIATPGV